MRTRTHAGLTAAVAAALALSAAGCGSADEKDVKEAANASLDPQGVVDNYRAAVIDGDGEAACDLLADAAKAVAEEGGTDCATRIAALAETDTPEDEAAEKAMHPQAVVDGDKAIAKFQTLGGDPTRIVLEKQGGAWKVTESPEIENFRISNGA